MAQGDDIRGTGELAQAADQSIRQTREEGHPGHRVHQEPQILGPALRALLTAVEHTSISLISMLSDRLLRLHLLPDHPVD